MRTRKIISASIVTAALAVTTTLAHPGHGGEEDPRGLVHHLGFHGLGIIVLGLVAVALGLAIQRSRGRRLRLR